MSSRQLRYTSVDYRERSTQERAIWKSSISIRTDVEATGTRRKRLGTNADRARVPELGLAIFQLLDTEKTGRAQQRRLKRRSHGGRKRIRGIKVLKTFFKERMID